MFVKICGITTEDDALLAVAMGADAVGFVFAPSERQINAGRARDIARRLPPEILTVGVFRNDARQRVVDVVNRSGLRAAQLHGHESAEDSRWIAERVPTVIVAFSAGDPRLDRAGEFDAAAILVDGPTPGSGELFDWNVLDGTQRGHRMILAGGLDPLNVADAVGVVKPWGVDVSSGVEVSPGRKDPAKVRAFIVAARCAAETYERDLTDSADRLSGPYDWGSDS